MRHAVEMTTGSANAACCLNTEELKIELDLLVQEHQILPMLHTQGCLPVLDGDRITAVAVENKDGRGAICARMFVDATGDGDIAVRAGVPYFERDRVQPPTTCAKIRHFHQAGVRFADLYREHHAEFGLSSGRTSLGVGTRRGYSPPRRAREFQILAPPCAP